MPGLPEGHGLRVFDEIDSTNSEAMRIAGSLAGPTWILAKRQTRGRGRSGRPWSTLPGNLAATLAMTVDEPPKAVALRTFVAALALRDAFRANGVEGRRVTLKWPNDVLLNGGKAAGILLECASVPGGRSSRLAVGFGVNLAAAPDPFPDAARSSRPVSLLGETGLKAEPTAFLETLAAAFAEREAQYCRSGFQEIRAEWIAHAERLGATASFRLSDRIVEGVFRTVDSAGRAIVEAAEGRLEIAAADLAF